MKELIRQHFGIVVLAVAILLAVIIHAATTRYVAVSAGGVTSECDVRNH